MKIDLKRVADLLIQHDDILILIHRHPDGDTIGSGYALCRALQKMGKRARVECADIVPERYDYITSFVKTEEFEPSFITVVDVADYKLLGEKYASIVDSIDLCIDHHASNNLFAKENYVCSTAAANCENIYRLIDLLGVEFDKNIAEALYTGIATDTGCFRFSNTTAETHIIAAKLIGYDMDMAYINRIMFDTKTKNRIMVERLALDSMEFYFDDRCAVITITKEMRKESETNEDDLEGITALPTQIEGVLVGITIRERDGGIFKASVRTYDPINASEMCAGFGGGGHARAAGCELHGSLEEIKSQLLAVTAEKLGVK